VPRLRALHFLRPLAFLAALGGSPAANAVERPAAVELPVPASTDALPLFRAEPRRVQGRLRTWAPGELDDTATATVLPGQLLRDWHQNLGEALDQQAGLRVQTLGGFGAPIQLQVRGSTAEQVAVYVDDVPLLALDGAPIDLADLPLGQVERVELYRSMTPALLGAGAMGGTLRLQLRQPAKPVAEWSAGLGSFGARQTELAAGWAGAQGRGSAGVRWLQAANDFSYLDQRGTLLEPRDDRIDRRSNAGVSRLGGSLGGQWRSGRWTFDGRWLGSGTDQGVPGPALFEARDAHLSVQRHLGVVAATRRDLLGTGDHLRLALHGGWTGQTVDDRAGELGAPWHARQTTAVAGAQLTYSSAPWGPAVLQARFGGSHGQVSVHDLRSNEQAPPSERSTLGAGVALPLTWGALELSPSFTLDGQQARRMTRNGVPTVWRELPALALWLPTARLGLAWRPRPGVHATLAWSDGMRPPSLQELFGNTLAIRGNAALEAERARTLDGGVTMAGQLGAVQGALQLAGFLTSARDLIQLQVYGQREALYQNVASAQLAGVELAGVLQIPHLRLTVQHSQLWTRDTGSDPAYAGKALPLRPGARTTARLDGDLHHGAWWGNGWLAVQAQSAYGLDAAQQVRVPGRAVAGLGARLGRGGWYVEARVDNVTDAVRVDLIGWPLPGRTFFAALGWRGWPLDS
jgi:iron complex outermembrane receptor protein